MNPAHFPKFLSVLLLGLVIPVHADIDIIFCGGIGGHCSITHTEDCILLKADGSRQTERCTVRSSVSGFAMPEPRQVVHAVHTIDFGKNPASITYDVLNSTKFYVDNAFQRSSGKTDDGYLCFPDTRPDTAICIRSVAANKIPFSH